MDEREKKAFDFAADLTKQLITLSTGIVTVTLLFSKDISGPKMLAVGAWASFLLSTIFGLWVLMALTGTLAPVHRAAGQLHHISLGANVRYPSGLQIASFGLATLLTLAYVFLAFSKPQSVLIAPSTCSCQCTVIPNAGH